MSRYRDNAEALRSLVQDRQVHRDVYLDQEVFALEMERLWARAWVYVGHDSQVPAAGDYITADIAGQPVVMVRQPDGTVKVLRNRCAHKGARLVSQPSGNTGRFFRCPYHAWTYKTDGALLSIPLRQGYAGTGLEACPAGQGMGALRHVENYRGFVFVRLSDEGPGFRDYFGATLSSIDNMVERSPDGELKIAGGVLRYRHDCNWKMFVENLNDTMHPMVAHESSAGTAKELWADQPEDAPKPMAIEQLVPFTSGYAFSDEMGVRVLANGHSYTGVGAVSLHAGYVGLPEYEARMAQAYGAERAAQILATVRHNTVLYPSLTLKGAIQAIRVVRPLAADQTVVESWTFRPKGAPDTLLRRTLMYTRLINSPMSVVGHDDLHAYRAMQQGLRADGNEWVSLHRNFDANELGQHDTTANGTSEISMRNQFRAWIRYMAPDFNTGDAT
ncbi:MULTISPECIES: aromatic ring-hydroxylating dioxygenase subunit alpha [Cupriavidus]|uniref:aromatic ring-hydroxylating dioxygenase subunit alpha n=1 Tax=Cupriavidus TaxID=106589 RepID=UPI002DB81262|nr:aromatic ring-hydroxylating dioxygenase subunit alpha [Cupriavidus sp. SS-3]MEC3766044.1 aromatic ring-hydroxylating dioxygenase subunit alpha [Cupriavidus sp. SS-3]